MGTLVMEQAAKLLDFSQGQIDVQLLDNVVHAMYNGQGAQQRMAQEILTQLKEHPDSWTRVDAILEFSKNPQTKYYALQILEKLVSTRWKTLPREQCDGIKNYIVGLVINISSNPTLLEQEKLYISKLNMVLVQIVKREWPQNWPTFISDIVGASRTNESLCQNNMVILRLLSEEVFDFSAGQMTQQRAHHLKEKFCGEFKAVFHLCEFVMENSQNAPLVEATLGTLLKFLSWVPLGYIFETQLIMTLITKFFNVPMFRNVTLQCLTEIAGVTIPPSNQDNYDKQFLALFLSTMVQLRQMLPDESVIKTAYAAGQDSEQKFIANLALFLCTFLKEHGTLVEVNPDQADQRELAEAHSVAMRYLLAISQVEETEIFKICLEYWNWLAAELYRDCPSLIYGSPYCGYTLAGGEMTPRRRLYYPHMSRLRSIMIGRMAKPEEVLVVENDQGEVVRETIKDTDAINLYKTMRETLVYLTHLDYLDTERIMTEKLQNQVNGTEWSWKNLNTLCWAIGSISGAMIEEDEKRFLVTVIRDLLGLCEQKRGKDNKAVIASNIMYVVGQYPRFLRAHWKFLKTVVNKLFEFMHETHEGVQDMACDTFIKIAHKCRRHFVIHQSGEAGPFIDEILMNLSSIICDLQPGQVHVFYEAVGFLISAQQESAVQDSLIERLMSFPNTIWDEIILHAAQNVDILKDAEVVKNLANILKTNVAACKSIGSPFLSQLGRIYLDMLNVYKVTSENISAAVALHGEPVLKQPLIKSMRGVKTEILRLISTWVAKAEDNNVVLTNFVPPLFDAVLFDYQRNVPAAREPEVLATMTAIVTKLESAITPQVPKIFDAVFECTLSMINKDFEEFPEHRTNFFLFLQAVNNHCFEAFLNISPAQFKLVLDSVIWAFKHSMRNVAEIGLDILQRLLQNVATKTTPEAAQSFYQTYFLELLEHLLSVVTDSSQAQVAGLTYYAQILAFMFHLVECGKITQSFNPATPNNVEYLFEFVAALLKKAFPHLTESQIRVIVKGFYSFNADVAKFKEHLRDFLVQIKEYAGEDTGDLYLEEREKEIQVAQEEKQKVAASVPGLLNPHEIAEDAMQDV